MRSWGPNLTAVIEWCDEKHPEWNAGDLMPCELQPLVNEALGMYVLGSTEIEEGAAMWLEAIKRQS